MFGLDGEGAIVAGVKVKEKMRWIMGLFIPQDGVDAILDDLCVRSESLVVHAVIADVSVYL